MTPAQLVLLLVVSVPLALVLFNRLRPDLAGLLIALALGIGQFFGLPLLGSTPRDAAAAIAGFGQPVIITLIALFVLTEGLEKYGVTRWMANRLLALGGTSERRLIVLFAAAAAALSLLMNNLAAGALLLPSALDAARRTGIKPSKLLIPLSYGTLLGGASTYFTTANIIMSGLLISLQPPQDPLSFLDFTPTGGLMTIAALLLIALIGPRLLPEHDSTAAPLHPGGSDLGKAYQLNERLWEIEIIAGSPLVGTTLDETRLIAGLGLAVAEIWRGRRTVIAPAPDFLLQADDRLIVVGRAERIEALDTLGVVTRSADEKRLLHARGVTLAELLVIPRSDAEGRTLRETGFQARTGFTAIALWRGERSYRTDVATLRLQRGDALLVVGQETGLETLRRSSGFSLLSVASSDERSDPLRTPLVVAIFAGAIVASVLGMPTYLAMLSGVVLILLFGLLTLDEMYQAIDWRVIFLIAGMFSISTAMTTTGTAAQLGNAAVALVAPLGGLGLIAGSFWLTVALTHVMGGQVTALVTGPIALTAALQLGINPQAVAVTVSIACSCAFLTPIAHPVHLLMLTPGNYRFSDFLRLGLPLLLLCFVMVLMGMRLFWGV